VLVVVLEKGEKELSLLFPKVAPATVRCGAGFQPA